MAGHSQFKNIMYRKGAQDKKRAKVFTKIIRELTTAARSGLPDPAANPRLRAAILAARQANMPRDTVERAVKRGSGGEAGRAYAAGSAHDMLEAVRDAGAENGESDAEQHLVTCAPEDLNAVRDALENRLGP